MMIEANNEVRRIDCAKWDDFIREVRAERTLPLDGGGEEFADRVLWRGHAKLKWKLESKIERSLVAEAKDPADGSVERLPHTLAVYDHRCAQTLRRFRELAHGKPGAYRDMPDDELWALGRHHGLITPLLDWTESPYVAAYFAFEKHRKGWEIEHGRGVIARKLPSDKPVCVWALRVWSGVEVSGEFEVVRDVPATAHRQMAQRGLFTRLRSADHLDVESYLKARNLAHSLEVYHLPGSAELDALGDFELMNITPATLFPDLYGAAQQANVDSDQLRFSASALANFKGRSGAEEE